MIKLTIKDLYKFLTALKIRIFFLDFFKKKIIIKRQKNNNKIINRIKLKKSPIKVIFLVNQCAKFNWNKLYMLLDKDERYEVLILNISEDRDEFERNNQYFEKIHFKIKSGYDFSKKKELNLKKKKPDIVFFEEVYYHIYKENSAYNVSKFALTCYGCYGIPLANHNLHHWNILEFHSFLWKHFLFDNFSKKNCEKTSFLKLTNTFLSGYPRFDELSKSNHFKNKNKVVIWAPHHSILDEPKFIKIIKSLIGIKSDLFSGTFDKNYKLFYKLAKKYSNITWILKPHPSLKDKIIRRGLMSKGIYEKYLIKWNSLENTKYNDSRDYIELFEKSDAIILDSIGFIAEYMVQNKPILFLNEAIKLRNKHYFNELGNYLMKGCYLINKNSEIEKKIVDVIINKNDNLKQRRMKIIEKFYIKGATGRIKKMFEDVFFCKNK